MSDWLLLGVEPSDVAGKAFYTHTMEEWIDIVSFVDWALPLLFSLNPDSPLSHLESDEAGRLARLIDAALADPVIVRRIKRGRWYQPGDDVIEGLKKFSTFLKSCGGYVTELGSG